MVNTNVPKRSSFISRLVSLLSRAISRSISRLILDCALSSSLLKQAIFDPQCSVAGWPARLVAVAVYGRVCCYIELAPLILVFIFGRK